MDGNDSGSPLVAGHLCFASGWCLNDKMGQSFLAIHAPVPLFAEKIGRPADMMMQRVKADRPTARVNWTIHPSDRLNCAPVMKKRYAFEHEGITAANAGERYYLRSEWQTFVRYPRTNAVLFTIRTRVTPLTDALTDPDAMVPPFQPARPPSPPTCPLRAANPPTARALPHPLSVLLPAGDLPARIGIRTVGFVRGASSLALLFETAQVAELVVNAQRL